MEKILIICSSNELDKEQMIKKIMLDFNLESSHLIEKLEVLSCPDSRDSQFDL